MSYRIDVRLEQPVQATDRPSASFHRSAATAVSGTALRGAFAKRWIAQNGPPDNQSVDEFVQLFHQGIRWCSLADDGTHIEPLSALLHKYSPADGCAHPEGFDRAHTFNAPDPGYSGQRCSCGGWLRPGKGTRIGARAADSRTRAGLEDVGGRRERASDGQLFTREGIKRGLLLSGTISGTHPWLDQISEPITIRLGGQLSVNGKCTATLTPLLPSDSTPAPLDDATVVIVRAESPAVLVDDGGRPILEPAAHELERTIGSVGEVVARWVRPTEVGGWDLVSGLPKPAEIAVLAGSTWLVRFEQEVTPDALSKLADGIGLRRVEGFGQVSVNPAPYAVTQPTDKPPRPQAVSAVRGSATKLKQLSDDEQQWAVGLLVDVASAKLTSKSPVSIAQDLTGRPRVAKLSPSKQTALIEVAEQDAETIKRVAMLVKAGL